MRTIFLFTPLLYFSIIQSTFANFEPYITEIMANPDGTDTGNEWIEIYNPGDEVVDLKGYILKNSNKEKMLDSFIIKGKSFEILTNETFNFSIKNSNEVVILLNPEGKILSEVKIEKSENGKSKAQTKIFKNGANETLWINGEPSPGFENPNFYEIEGKITQEIKIGKIAEIEIDHKKVNIPENFDINTLKAFTKEGDKIKALLKIEEKSLTLAKIKISNDTKKDEKKSATPYFLLIPISLIGIYLIIESDLSHALCCKSAARIRPL